MYPVLFTIPLFGGIPIYTYGLMVACGFLVGMWWVGREARRLGDDPALAVDLVFWIIVGAIVGARIFYILEKDLDRFFSDPLSLMRIWEGGLVFHGGLIGALLASVIFSRRHKKSFWRYADMAAPAIALGHMFGRIGCTLVGCCYGRAAPHDAWFSMVFPDHVHTVAPSGVALYPTQPAEALGNLLIFVILVLIRKRMRATGQVFAVYLMLYGMLRIVGEMFRSDASREFLFGSMISSAQAVSGLAIAFGLGLWCVQQRRGA